MAEKAHDPYNFENDDYVESTTPNFNESFMELFVYGNRRVNEFHTAAEPSDPAVQNVENVAQQRDRKRKADPSSWTRNARKMAVMRGEESSDYKERPIAARKTGSDCECKRECFTNVGEEERQNVLERFNSIENRNLQNMYLRGLIVGKEPKRLGAGGCKGANKPGKERRRLFVYEYYVQKTNLTRIQVCREAFVSIHGITVCRAKTVRARADPTDRRGRHDNRPNKLTDNLKNQVRVHIQSLLAQTSHYSRVKTSYKKNLSPELPVNRMHLLYLEKFEEEVFKRDQEILRCKQENSFPIPPPIKPKISLYSYRHIFNTEFKMRIFRSGVEELQ